MKQQPKIYYDKSVDALWIRIKKAQEADSEEIAPGMTIEYDTKGAIIGLEILNASSMFKLMQTPPKEILKHAHYVSS